MNLQLFLCYTGDKEESQAPQTYMEVTINDFPSIALLDTSKSIRIILCSR